MSLTDQFQSSVEIFGFRTTEISYHSGSEIEKCENTKSIKINLSLQVEVFWVVTPCSVPTLRKKFLSPYWFSYSETLVFLPNHYTASQPGRPGL